MSSIDPWRMPRPYTIRMHSRFRSSTGDEELVVVRKFSARPRLREKWSGKTITWEPPAFPQRRPKRAHVIVVERAHGPHAFVPAYTTFRFVDAPRS